MSVVERYGAMKLVKDITIARCASKKGKTKVKGVPQSHTAALPRHKRKGKPTNPNKHKSNKRTRNALKCMDKLSTNGLYSIWIVRMT